MCLVLAPQMFSASFFSQNCTLTSKTCTLRKPLLLSWKTHPAFWRFWRLCAKIKRCIPERSDQMQMQGLSACICVWMLRFSQVLLWSLFALQSISWCLQMVGGAGGIQMVKPHFGWFTFYFTLPFVSPINLYIYAAGSVMFCLSCFCFFWWSSSFAQSCFCSLDS